MEKKLLKILIIFLCAMVSTSPALAQELLQNSGFEIWTAGPNGPPDHWYCDGWPSGDSLDARREDGIVHTGSYSAELTWSTTNTRYLTQPVPIEGGITYTLRYWAFDNDPAGRARAAIRWYNGDGEFIDGHYPYTPSTLDLASWQLIEIIGEAPVLACTARVDIRVYDVHDPPQWDGDATIYVDDASFTMAGSVTPETLSIYEVQHNAISQGNGSDCYPSSWNGQWVKITGVITALSQGTFPVFWIQDSSSVWNGVYVFDSSFQPARGDSVTLTALVAEHYGLTELNSVMDYDTLSTGNPEPTPLNVTPGDIAGGCAVGPEAYEGVLVKLTNVTCAQQADSVGRWYVTDGSDTCQIDDACFPYEPCVEEPFAYLIGVVHYDDGEYQILPRDEADMPPKLYFKGISHTPTIPPEDQPVTVMASIIESGGTKSVIADSVHYRIGSAGALMSVVGGGLIGDYYYYTIPGQDDGDTVFFYISADNGTTVKKSAIQKYQVNDEPPLIKINEFMYDSPGADAGCFIEIYGAPGLSLNGYSLVMVNGFDGTDKKVIDLSGYSIPGDGYFVVAQDATVPNYDLIDALADFENGPDNIQIKKDGFIYDAVGYGTFLQEEYFMGEAWPTYDPGYPYGFSLGRYPDGSDWDYNRRDFGVYGSAYNTPGTTNNDPTAYSIYAIQNVPKSDSPHNGERVTVGGIVTVDPTECTDNPGYYIEMSSGGPWSGILVYDLFYEPTRGDSVKVKGTVTEEFRRTQISYVTNYTNYGAGTMPDPYPSTTGNVRSDESLEGVLVQVMNVTVVDTMGYGEFLVTDGAVADTVMVDDICGYSTTVVPGDEFALIRGVVDYSFGYFRIQPRDDDDFMEFAPANLTATKSSGDIYLQWTAQDAAQYYVILRSTDPTVEGDSLGSVSPPGTSYLDIGATGNTGTNYYYVIQARYAFGGKSDSRQVGEFDKYLTKTKSPDGFTLVSWPLLPHDTNIQAVFADTMGQGCQLTGYAVPIASDLVLYWDAATFTWQTAWYRTGALPVWKGNLTTIEPDKGYWIFIRGTHPAVTLTMTGVVNWTPRTIPIEPGPSCNYVGTLFAIDRHLGGASPGDSCGLLASGFDGGATWSNSSHISYFDGSSWYTTWYKTGSGAGWKGTLGPGQTNNHPKFKPGNGYRLEVKDGHDFTNDEWIYPIPPDDSKGSQAMLSAKTKASLRQERSRHHASSPSSLGEPASESTLDGKQSKSPGCPNACLCYGGMNESSYWSLLDYFEQPLEDGDYVYVAWTGPDGQIDPPAPAKGLGAPSDDDSLLIEGSIEDGRFFITATTWGSDDGHPQGGEWIYCRIFDGPKGELTTSNYYSNSQAYECEGYLPEVFICLFPGDPDSGRTDTPLSADMAPPEAIDDLSVALESGTKSTAGDMCLWWTEPYDDVGVIRYVVYRSTAPDSLGDSLAGTPDTTYTDVGAAGTVGTNYFYVVKAVDASGKKSEKSNRVGEFDRSLFNAPPTLSHRQKTPNEVQ